MRPFSRTRFNERRRDREGVKRKYRDSRRMDGQVEELWGQSVILCTESSRGEKHFCPSRPGAELLSPILPRNKSFVNCAEIEIANGTLAEVGRSPSAIVVEQDERWRAISLKSFRDEIRRKRGFTMFVFSILTAIFLWQRLHSIWSLPFCQLWVYVMFYKIIILLPFLKNSSARNFYKVILS